MSTPSPLDDIEFIARSPHRLAVITLLQQGSWSRPDLREETEISQPTLGRVLDSLRDRSWVTQEGREYRLTPYGALVTEAFTDLLDTIDTFHQLGDLIALLPTEEMDFDLRRFAGASVTTPETGDMFGHVRRVEALVYGADDLRLLSTTMPPGTDEEQAERAESFFDGDQTIESVITADTLEQTFESIPETPRLFASMIALDRVQLYRYEGTIPFMAGVADGIAFLVPMDDDGQPAAIVESTDEIIRRWVDELVDGYREESTPITVDDLPP